MEGKDTGGEVTDRIRIDGYGDFFCGKKVSNGTRGVAAGLGSIGFDYDDLCSLMTLAVSTVRREGSMPKEEDKTSRQRL